MSPTRRFLSPFCNGPVVTTSPLPFCLSVSLSCLSKKNAAYESWPAAKGPQPVAKPLVKKPVPVPGAAGGNDAEEKVLEVEAEADDGEATPDGNKRALADILSVGDLGGGEGRG